MKQLNKTQKQDLTPDMEMIIRMEWNRNKPRFLEASTVMIEDVKKKGEHRDVGGIDSGVLKRGRNEEVVIRRLDLCRLSDVTVM